MYVTEIEIKDLRCFSGVQRLSLDRGDGSYAGWTVFAGRNGAGKSTLLKTIGATLAGPLAAQTLSGSFPAWVRRGAKSAHAASRVLIDIEHDRFEERNGRILGLWMLPGLCWFPNDPDADTLEPWIDEKKWNNGSVRHLEIGPWAKRPRGWFVAGYGPYRHLGPASSEAERFKKDPSLARLINLFNVAATLSDAVDWLKDVQLRAHEHKPGAAELRDVVLRLLNDGLLPDSSRVDRVDSDGLWIERSGVTLPLEHVSDGYRTVAALVVDLVRRLHDAYKDVPLGADLTCPLPGVVLIDEVDSHMHVEWQQKIGFWLTRHFPALQFLVTTHSPFICQAASPRGLIRLPAPGERRKMDHVNPRLFNAIVNGSADDAVMSELFGLEHAHSEAAEELREQVAELELKALREVATRDDLRRYEELKALLPNDLGEQADRRFRAMRSRRDTR